MTPGSFRNLGSEVQGSESLLYWEIWGSVAERSAVYLGARPLKHPAEAETARSNCKSEISRPPRSMPKTSIQALGENYLRPLGGNNRTRQHA